MSLRKGSIKEYYNSKVKCEVLPGKTPECYQNKVKSAIQSKLLTYREGGKKVEDDLTRK